MPTNINITTPPLLDSTAQQIVREIESIANGGSFNQTTELPVASYFYAGKVIQYTGATTASLTHNYFYECVEDNGSYSWQQTNVQSDEGTSIIQIPSVVVGTYTYNGAAQGPGPDITGLDTTHCNVSNGTATDAGTYTLTISLKNPSTMVWSDLTNADKTYQYTISKADQVIVSDKSSVTVDSEHLTATFEVTGNITGLTVSSDDTSVATVSEEDGTVTVSSVNETTGTATISVYANSSANYNQSNTVQVEVTASFVPILTNILNDNSWEAISYAAQNNLGANYWNVGDRKAVAISGTVGILNMNGTYYAYILGFNHNQSKEGTAIHFQFGFDALSGGNHIAFCDSSYNSYNSSQCFNMNPASGSLSSTNVGGWNSSKMRTVLIPQFKNALPAALRSVLKAVTKYTDNVGNKSNVAANVTTTSDEIFLLAEYEVFGEQTYANQYESTDGKQAQYSYYANGNSKIMKKHSDTSTAVIWGERSAFYNDTRYFCRVYSGGSKDGSDSGYSIGFAPGFAVG